MINRYIIESKYIKADDSVTQEQNYERNLFCNRCAGIKNHD